MFGKIKSILSGKGISGSKSKNDKSFTTDLRDSCDKLSNLTKDYFSNLLSDLKIMRDKSKNLLKTNVNLGLKHLNNDKISDAIFRFRIINILWPNHVKTYYYLAHCYILKKKYKKADVSIKKLLEMDPSYSSRVTNMINKIDDAKNE